MIGEDDIRNDVIPEILDKTKRHKTSLDFTAKLMQRIEMISELKLNRQRYLKRVAVFIVISIVLAICLTFILSGLNTFLHNQTAQFREVVQVFLMSIMLMLGGLILYLGNAFMENRSSNMI